MSAGAAVADVIRAHARALKMPGLARQYEALARQAEKERWSFEEYLAEALAAEIASRVESVVRQRLSEAHFPDRKTLDQFDFATAEGVEGDVVARLARCDWIDQGQNVLLVGPIGTGKTHLAIALGIEAAKRRLRVGFFRAADLVRALVEARDARELGRLQRKVDRLQLLIIDELGFVPFDRQGGELLFGLVAQRYERRSVLLTSNLSFGEWTKVFGGDEKLTTALLDRVAHHATVIATRGKSYRMRMRDKPEPRPPQPDATPPRSPPKKPR